MKSPTPCTVTIDQVPPYCYRQPGMSAEAGSGAAVKALGITHPCDAVALLWALRQAAKAAPSGTSEKRNSGPWRQRKGHPITTRSR